GKGEKEEIKDKKKKRKGEGEGEGEIEGKGGDGKSEAIVTERDHLARVPLPSGGPSFTVLSWNVNGLRALVKNSPEILKKLAEEERPDLFCLQETKLQEKDVESMRKQDLIPGYESVWSCSTTKKGYSGTAVFFPKQNEPWKGQGQEEDCPEPVKKKRKQAKMSAFLAPEPSAREDDSGGEAKAGEKQKGSGLGVGLGLGLGSSSPVLPGGRSMLKVKGVSFGIGDARHDGEGRAITVEYEKLYVVAVYVPNSGQKLERLAYRTGEWDVSLQKYIQSLEEGGDKGVVLTGDLNVAHL
ncbi:unnamed protein product, partial [Discosporangium mesarthrocarpum]